LSYYINDLGIGGKGSELSLGLIGSKFLPYSYLLFLGKLFKFV